MGTGIWATDSHFIRSRVSESPDIHVCASRTATWRNVTPELGVSHPNWMCSGGLSMEESKISVENCREAGELDSTSKAAENPFYIQSSSSSIILARLRSSRLSWFLSGLSCSLCLKIRSSTTERRKSHEPCSTRTLWKFN